MGETERTVEEVVICSDFTLIHRLKEFITENADEKLINPASIDIRVGRQLKAEDLNSRGKLYPRFFDVDLTLHTETEPYVMHPGAFVLVSTLETICVPSGFGADIRLKSSRGRQGYQHALCGWIDPGWHGIITMELRNVTQSSLLPLYPGMRIAQVVYYCLTTKALSPYVGRYQGATTVEAAKDM